VAAKEAVLREVSISKEIDLIRPTLLNKLICHIASLASVYHKPPTAFVEGKVGRDVMEINTSAGCADSERFRLTRQVKVDS